MYRSCELLPIQKELRLTDEWEAHLLRVVTAATKLATHSGVKESVLFFVLNVFLHPAERANWELRFTTHL